MGLFGSSPKVTLGHWYRAGIQFVLCRSAEKILKVRVQDKDVFDGEVTTDQSAVIDALGIFGGIKNGGGMQGQFIFASGGSSQSPNSYMVEQLGSDIPASRGVVSTVWDGGIVGNSPYAQPPSFQVQRFASSLTEVTSNIGLDMNPAHIIWEVFTNGDEMVGVPEANLDRQSFIDAATTLQTEGFGLSMLWSNPSSESSAEEFIKDVLRHIDGVVVPDPVTQQLKLTLMRDDYAVGSIGSLTENEIIDVKDHDKLFVSELVSGVAMAYTDRATGGIRSFPMFNQAVQDIATSPKIENLEYLGINESDLAKKVASRELAKRSQSLASLTLELTTDQRDLRPGDVRKISWPPLGLEDFVIRIVTVEQDNPQGTSIVVKAIEDIFARGAAEIAGNVGSTWVAPDATPVAPTRYGVFSLPYWLHEKFIGPDNPETQSRIFAVSNGGGDLTLGINTEHDSGSGYSDGDEIPVYGSGLLNAAVDMTQIQIVVNAFDFPNEPESGDLLFINSEIMEVTAWAAGSSQLTVRRGVCGSLPQDHVSASTVWLVSDDVVVEGLVFTSAVAVSTRLRTRTVSGTLSQADGVTVAHTPENEALKPYAPANPTVNGGNFDFAGEIVVSSSGDRTFGWGHSDRTEQVSDTPPSYQDATANAEIGATYTLRIYASEGGSLLRTVAGISGTSYVYTEANQQSDFGLIAPNVPSSFWFELETNRGTLTSPVWGLSVTT